MVAVDLFGFNKTTVSLMNVVTYIFSLFCPYVNMQRCWIFLRLQSKDYLVGNTGQNIAIESQQILYAGNLF